MRGGHALAPGRSAFGAPPFAFGSFRRYAGDGKAKIAEVCT